MRPEGACGVWAFEEFVEALVGVFFGEVVEWGGGGGEEFGAVGPAGRVAGDAADGVEELLALFGGDGVGGLELECGAFVEGGEVVGDGFGDGGFFGVGQVAEEIGHEGARFGLVGDRR